MKIESPRVAIDRHEAQRRVLSFVFKSALFATIALLAFGMLAAPQALAYMMVTLVLSGVTGLFTVARLPVFVARAPGVVDIDGGTVRAVTQHRTLSFALADITDGWLQPGGRVSLRLQTGVVLELDLPSEAEGQALLEACGLAARQRALSVPLPSEASAASAGTAIATAGAGVLGCGSLFALAVLAVGLSQLRQGWDGGDVVASLLILGLLALLGTALRRVVGTLSPGRAIIGLDGVRVDKGLASSFVPHDDIAEIVPDERGVRLERRSAPALHLRTVRAGDRPLPPFDDLAPPASEAATLRQTLITRLRDARAGEGAPPSIASLDRSGRPLKAWRADLARLTSADGGYRAQGLSRDALLEVLESGRSLPERRVAVAMALRDTHDLEVRQRVRVAIDTCADEDLKRALEQAAEGELEEELLLTLERKRA